MNIDAAAAQRFLAEQFDPTARDVEPAGAGAWSCAFSFHRGTDALIVRFGNHGDDFAKDWRAYRYRTAGLPVPEVLALGPALGGFYTISRQVRGVPRRSQAAPGAVQSASTDSHPEEWQLRVGESARRWRCLGSSASSSLVSE